MSDHVSVRYLAISVVNGGRWPKAVEKDWQRLVDSAQKIVDQKESLLLSVSEE